MSLFDYFEAKDGGAVMCPRLFSREESTMGVKLAHEVRFKTHTPCPKCKTAMERTVTQRLVCPKCEFNALVEEAMKKGVISG